MKLAYFNIEYAVKIHDEIIQKSGGKEGHANLGLTEATLELIQNDEYYPTFEEKLSHLFYCLAKNHSFIDGNKRSAIALSAYFLEINGYKQHLINLFIQEMENIVVYVADNKIDKSLLNKLIKCLITEGEFSEELKLEMIECLT